MIMTSNLNRDFILMIILNNFFVLILNKYINNDIGNNLLYLNVANLLLIMMCLKYHQFYFELLNMLKKQLI